MLVNWERQEFTHSIDCSWMVTFAWNLIPLSLVALHANVISIWNKNCKFTEVWLFFAIFTVFILGEVHTY